MVEIVDKMEAAVAVAGVVEVREEVVSWQWRLGCRGRCGVEPVVLVVVLWRMRSCGDVALTEHWHAKAAR